MRRLLIAMALAAVVLSPAQAQQNDSGCTVAKSALGASIGGLIVAILFPGAGFFVGAAIAAGGTCWYHHRNDDRGSPASHVPSR
jgi:hypothetical protein